MIDLRESKFQSFKFKLTCLDFGTHIHLALHTPRLVKVEINKYVVNYYHNGTLSRGYIKQRRIIENTECDRMDVEKRALQYLQAGTVNRGHLFRVLETTARPEEK